MKTIALVLVLTSACSFAKITGVASSTLVPQSGQSFLCNTNTAGSAPSPCAISQSLTTLDTSWQLPKWRLALSRVRDGVANARILHVGDSTTWGAGSTGYPGNPNAGSMPTRVAQLSNSSSTPFANGLGIPPTYLVAGSVDNRWTAGSGWAVVQRGFAGNASYQCASTCGSLVFTPTVNNDSFYVYYVGGTGAGTITMTASGGTPIAVKTGSLANGQYRTLVTAAGISSGNTMTITQSGVVNVLGVEPLLSGTKQVLVGNAGVGGSLSTQWISTGQSGALTAIGVYAPDLTIISLGINDANSGVTSATYQANLQAIITEAQLSGDVILLTMPPSNGAPYTTYEPQYVAAMYALSAADNIPVLDFYYRMSQVWNKPFMYDALHPNNLGYWDWAQLVSNFIMRAAREN